jgi:uncharacterized membrane protein YphA (DoxX/SURF4 family)
VPTLLIALRLVLVAAFATSAIAKLRGMRAFRASLRDFGLNGWQARALSLLVPLAELGAAVLLLPSSTAWLGAVVALTLLIVFSGGVIVAMARGRTPECHCFGHLLAGPVGWHTLARNAGFIACALLILFAGTQT